MRKPRKPRREVRYIDKLVTPDDQDGIDQKDIDDLTLLWPSIERKGPVLALRDSWRRQGRRLARLPAKSMLNEAEVAVLFKIVRPLMHTPESDSTLRDHRDELIAADYIFHRDILKHEIVMPGVCARWEVSDSVAKKAIRRQRKSALAHLQNRRESHAYFKQLTTEDPKYYKDLVSHGIDPEESEAQMISRELRGAARDYREGRDGWVQPRKRKKKL